MVSRLVTQSNVVAFTHADAQIKTISCCDIYLC